MLTRKRNKKTYLDKILQQLSDEPLEWNDMVSNIKSNWNEETTFNEEFIIKSIIKGIISNKIEKLTIDNIKNKYKGHSYKLMNS